MKILSLYRKHIPFIANNKGVNYASYIVTSLTMTPEGAIKGFANRGSDKSIHTRWFRLCEDLSIKSNGNIAAFKQS